MRGTLRFFGWYLVLSMLLWKLMPVLGIDFSKVPGTFTFQVGRYGIQVPVLFCLVISIFLTVLVRGFRQLVYKRRE